MNDTRPVTAPSDRRSSPSPSGGRMWGADLRHAATSLARSPGFAAAAILSLALGIAANTAIFSVVNTLLLKPLDYRDADRLVILWNRSPGLGITEDWFSTAQYFDIRNGHRGLEEVAIAFGNNLNLTGRGEPERVGVVRVSSGFLPLLGAEPAMGRLFAPGEDTPGRPPVAILTHGLWVRRFGSDPGILGRPITLNGQSFEVAGVLTPAFSLPREVVPTLYGGDRADIFLPLPLNEAAPRTRTREDYNIIGRLRPGVTVAEAQAEMDTITANLRRDHPDVYPPNGGLTFSVVPFQEQVVGGTRRTLYVLLGAVGFVLLVACANVANLLLARGVARQKDVAVRLAFGAGRGRVLRQWLLESLILAAVSGAIGTVLASWTVAWVRAAGPRGIPRLGELAVDGRVLVFALGLSIVTVAVFGLLPAIRMSRVDLNTALKATGRGASAGGALWGRGHHLRRAFVVAEVALSIVLLIGAGLLLRSFARLQQVDPGFDPAGRLTFGLTFAGQRYGSPQAVLATYQRLWERLGRVPGVVASGGVSSLPLSQAFAWTPISVEGRTPPPGEKFINTDERVASGRYFEAMGIPLVSGRLFNDADTAESPRVVVIDERMARDLWPGQDPVGRRVRHGGETSTAPWMTVVGVVGRVKHDGLDSDPRIAMYLPHAQAPVRALSIVVRGQTDPAALTGAVRSAVREIDPDLPLYQVAPMTDLVAESMVRRRFTMILLGLFAGFALVLAAIGLYGVLSYLVGQGERDLGVRVALGSTPGRVVTLVVGQGARLALAGVVAGVAGALAMTRLMTSLLFEVAPTDPATFVAVPAVLFLVALAACYVPARRAARVDPVVALRYE